MKKLTEKILATICIVLLTTFGCDDLFRQEDASGGLTADVAKRFYESRATGMLNLKSGNTSGKTIAIRPDWVDSKKSGNDRFEVVEAPLVFDGLSFFTKESLEHWEVDQNPDLISKSAMVVQMDKKSGSISCFIMTVFDDFKRSEKDNTNLSGNGYLKKNEDFNGYVLFHELDGQFSNGWYFERGKVKRKVVLDQENDMEFQLKSAYYSCLVVTTTLVEYIYYPSTGTYKITSVTEITTYENCIPLDSDTGAGGYTGPAVKISSNLKPFVKSSTLNQTQLDKLSLAFDQFKIKNCATLALYNKLLGSGVSFNFSIDKTIPGYASYDPSDKSIKFKSEDFITQENVYEELIHAWQDKIYPGGVSQFQKYPYIGLSNIEFEPRMLTGVMENLIGFTVRSIGESFDKLVFQIADYYKQNGKFPSQLSIAQETLYFKTIDEMKAQIPAYNKPTNTNLKPNAVFDILNGAANCSPIE